MSSQLDESTALSEPTDVRFGTRSLLIVMVVVAVTSTLLGVLFRLFPPEVRPWLALNWLIFVALLAAFIAYNARRRYAAEKLAGPVRFRLAPHSYFLPRMPRLARLGVGTLLLLCGPVYWAGLSVIVADEPVAILGQILNWQTYFALFASASGLNYLWWHSQVRLCDEGVVVRHQFAPWSESRRWYWDASYRDVAVIGFDKKSPVAVKVPPEERAAVDAYITNRKAMSSAKVS